MKHEPILTLFGDSLKKTFPLILVIGREPNTEGIIDDSVSTYDWRDAPHGFWATANEVVAEVNEVPPWEFKAFCEKHAVSPVAISNAMPVCVPDGSRRQRNQRESTTPEQKEQHAGLLLKHARVLARVRMVWLCGLEGAVFQRFCDRVVASLGPQARVIHLPFMRNTNRPRIRETLNSHDTMIMREIWDACKSGV